MKEINRVVIAVKGEVCSLCWQGDTLIDWVDGGGRYSLDGSYSGRAVNYAYDFDYAITSTNGRYAALVTRLGTKGLILKEGKIIREINRSFYQANVYEYPITFLDLPDGRTALAHCPDEYCRLEIEEVESGERLTERASKSPDFFHSRLSVSPGSRHLSSAGWIWHPFDDVCVYDLEQVLNNPELLDADTCLLPRRGVPITTASFLSDDLLVISSSDEDYDSDDVEVEEEKPLPPYFIGVYDLHTKSLRTQAPLTEPAGTLMPLGENFAVGFYKHPKLIDLNSGTTLHKWEELSSGLQLSSIIWHLDNEKLPPPMAFDPKNKRFAIASEQEITVVQLGE